MVFSVTSNRRCNEKEEEMFNISGDYERNVSRLRNMKHGEAEKYSE